MTKKERSKKEVLEDLFLAVADELLAQVEGEESPSPAVLSAAIRFLQNNGIEAADDKDPAIQEIRDKVIKFRDFQDEDEDCLPDVGGLNT